MKIKQHLYSTKEDELSIAEHRQIWDPDKFLSQKVPLCRKTIWEIVPWRA